MREFSELETFDEHLERNESIADYDNCCICEREKQTDKMFYISEVSVHICNHCTTIVDDETLLDEFGDDYRQIRHNITKHNEKGA